MLPSVTVPGPEIPPRSALGSTPRSTGHVARDVILLQPGRVYIGHLNGEPMQQSNTVPSTYHTITSITLKPLVAQILRTVLPVLVLDPTALKNRFTKAEARKMIACAEDKISAFDSKFTTNTIADQALVLQDMAVKFGRQSFVALSILRIPNATRSQDQRIVTNELSFALQTCPDKFFLHLMLSAKFGSGFREQDGLYVLLPSFDGFSNQAQMTRSLRPQNANWSVSLYSRVQSYSTPLTSATTAVTMPQTDHQSVRFHTDRLLPRLNQSQSSTVILVPLIRRGLRVKHVGLGNIIPTMRETITTKRIIDTCPIKVSSYQVKRGTRGVGAMMQVLEQKWRLID